jgi:Pvc16 N-terminal domain
LSSPLAIGAVSAVLRNLLDNAIVEQVALGTTVTVTAMAPDTIKLDAPQDPPQLNIFLHQVTPNAAWRNRELPSRSTDGERISNPPLALDLHYLITAYGRTDFQAEILLGYAMHLLHERPVLDRPAIRRALTPSPLDTSMLPPAFQALTASDLADQLEAIKITPAAMPVEEMSKLWAAIQSHYRPSAAYDVSVVLIDAKKPARTPLPVLSRGPRDPITHRDRGVVVNPDLLPPLPTLLEIEFAAKQTVARLGEAVKVTGVRLAGSGAVARLMHRLLDVPVELPMTLDASGKGFTFTLPNDAAAQTTFMPGLWQLSVRFTPTGETIERETNGIALPIAPDPVLAADASLSLPAATAIRGGSPSQVTVTMHSRPQVRLAQQATLALDGTSALAAGRAAASDPLVFVFPDSVPAGNRWVRLRVDGVDSPLVLRSGPEPTFDPTQRIAVPA